MSPSSSGQRRLSLRLRVPRGGGCSTRFLWGDSLAFSRDIGEGTRPTCASRPPGPVLALPLWDRQPPVSVCSALWPVPICDTHPVSPFTMSPHDAPFPVCWRPDSFWGWGPLTGAGGGPEEQRTAPSVAPCVRVPPLGPLSQKDSRAAPQAALAGTLGPAAPTPASA